ncbi:MAG: hypothetical protein DRP56_01045 [Planctomycetota bacterium]|nr:MAG: hypothetical protein DRP56_01045 [Planctomycetota bacterium]
MSRVKTQKRVAAVDVFEETIVASIFDGHRVKRRIVTAGEVVRMFSAAAAGSTVWQDLSGSVVATGTTAGGAQRVLVVRKAKKTPITVQIGKRTYHPVMRMPNLLAEMTRTGDQWTKVNRVLAFCGTLKKTTPLYVAPLPNMYADGNVCMGDVAMTPLANRPAAEAFEVAYIDSLFSDHTLDGPMRTAKPYRNIWHAIKQTKGKVPFSVLKKVTTYGELLKN